jgi:hypothetical protein
VCNDRLPRDSAPLNGRPTVVALVLGPKNRARLRVALSDQAEVQFCDVRSELVPLIAATFATAVFAEARDRNGENVSVVVGALRARYPSIPVIAYVPNEHTPARDILAMARAGVNDLILAGIDDVGFALGAALSSALSSAVDVWHLPNQFGNSEPNAIVTRPAPDPVSPIARPPGMLLDSIAEFLCSRRTYTEVFVQVIGDLREEHAAALAEGRIWKARWVRVRATLGFAEAMLKVAPIFRQVARWISGLGGPGSKE